MEEARVADLQNRFDFRAEGMGFDLRLVDVCSEEWEQWQDELLGLATMVINEMCQCNPHYDLHVHPQIFVDWERSERDILFRYCSEVGKVEVLFNFEPKTHGISYNRMIPVMYEEVFSLF